MRTATTTRVAHPFAHFAKGWGIALSATILLCLGTAFADAQTTPCGLTSLHESAALIYPPIAKVAHMEGRVISMVKFSPLGSVEQVAFVSGAEMLKPASEVYLKGLKANEYDGPRECPMVIEFALVDAPAPCEYGQEPAVPIQRSDLQHISIRSQRVWLCDPPAEIKRHKRFIFF